MASKTSTVKLIDPRATCCSQTPAHSREPHLASLSPDPTTHQWGPSQPAHSPQPPSQPARGICSCDGLGHPSWPPKIENRRQQGRGWQPIHQRRLVLAPPDLATRLFCPETLCPEIDCAFTCVPPAHRSIGGVPRLCNPCTAVRHSNKINQSAESRGAKTLIHWCCERLTMRINHSTVLCIAAISNAQMPPCFSGASPDCVCTLARRHSPRPILQSACATSLKCLSVQSTGSDIRTSTSHKQDQGEPRH